MFSAGLCRSWGKRPPALNSVTRFSRKTMFNRIRFTLLFLFLLAFRTLFGLSMQFFGTSEPQRDALQTYLIGLKFYTTGAWPYYGPDQYLMTRNFHTQIP